MLVFLDTEFADFVEHDLIGLALVVEDLKESRMPLQMIKICSLLSDGSPATATGSIEVRPSSLNGAVTLRLPTGEVRVWQRALLTAVPMSGPDLNGQATISIRGIEGLRSLHQTISGLLGDSENGWVPVKKVGNGTSDKSCKVQVDDVIYQYTPNDIERKTHALTVPVSQLRDQDGQLFAPRWLLKKTIHERILDCKSWPHDIKNGQYLDADALWEGFFYPIEMELANQEASLVERQQQHQAEYLFQKQVQTERVKMREAALAQEAAKRRVSAEQRARRKDQLETLEVASVEWDEWVVTKNKYGSKNQTKTIRTAEKCTLKFAGQRVYIQLPGGTEHIKMRQSVRWVV